MLRSPLLSSETGFLHFFGTRDEPADLRSCVQVGQLTQGPSAYRHVVSLQQVHGTRVVVLDQSPRPKQFGVQAGDALVTNQIDVVLVVRTADCVPLLVADLKQRIIATIHAGWRGLLAGIVPKTLDTLQTQFGSVPETLRVAIGPSIGVCCYEVDRPVLQRLQETVSSWRDCVEEVETHTAKLNLRKVAAGQVANFGVSASNVSQTDLCTRCHPELFYSYRRDGRVEGTMMSGIMLRRV